MMMIVKKPAVDLRIAQSGLNRVKVHGKILDRSSQLLAFSFQPAIDDVDAVRTAGGEAAISALECRQSFSLIGEQRRILGDAHHGEDLGEVRR